MNKSVAVIGAGVSGITTAVLLQHFNFNVTIYSKDLPSSPKKNPHFASQYPSASIIPHSVYHSELERIFKNSQEVFSSIYEMGLLGVQKHEHFELFAFKNDTPNYAKDIAGYKKLSNVDWHPKHPEIEIKSGWKFDCYFADWTIYYPSIVQIFLNNNGVFITENVDLNSFDHIKEDIIINCSGSGSHQLERETEPLILMGHLLKIENTPAFLSPNNKPVSYNFSPGEDIYSDSFGNPFDVYLYPRKNDLILGGSRFKGTLDKDGNWVSKDPLSSEFPTQIHSINADILKHSFSINLDLYKNIEYQKAYRYVRNTKGGLRVERDANSSRFIVHNYGHGGAGVTLSWGAAFEVLNLLTMSSSIETYNIEEVAEVISTI